MTDLAEARALATFLLTWHQQFGDAAHVRWDADWRARATAEGWHDALERRPPERFAAEHQRYREFIASFTPEDFADLDRMRDFVHQQGTGILEWAAPTFTPEDLWARVVGTGLPGLPMPQRLNDVLLQLRTIVGSP